MEIINWIVNLGEFILFFGTGLGFIFFVAASIIALILAVF